MLPSDALLHNAFYGNYYIRMIAMLGFAFLMGTIVFGPLLKWLCGGLDERIGQTAGGLAPALNAGKAFIPVAIAFHGGGTEIGLGAGLAVILGHCYCPWLKFRGGKDDGVQFGVLAGLCWPAALAFAAIWLAAAISSNYAVVGTVLAGSFTVVSLWFFIGADGALYGVVAMLVIASRYRDTFARLQDACEPTMRTPEPVAPASVVRFKGQPMESF